MAKGLAESEPETQKQKPLASNFHQRFFLFFPAPNPQIPVFPGIRVHVCLPAIAVTV